MERKYNSSNLCKNVVKGWKNLNDGLAWNVGNGKSVCFWTDKWLMDTGPLKDLDMCNLIDKDLGRTVEDFVTRSGCWHWDVIQPALPNHICLNLTAIPPPLASANPDHIRREFGNGWSIFGQINLCIGGEMAL